MQRKPITIRVETLELDLLQENIQIEFSQLDKKLIECTDFWEYLDNKEKKALLNNLQILLEKDDTLVLTLLDQNRQREIFNKIGFKKLYETSLYVAYTELSEYFKLEQIYLNNNETYLTFILKKK